MFIVDIKFKDNYGSLKNGILFAGDNDKNKGGIQNIKDIENVLNGIDEGINHELGGTVYFQSKYINCKFNHSIIDSYIIKEINYSDEW